jgi:hypothetical protein
MTRKWRNDPVDAPLQTAGIVLEREVEHVSGCWFQIAEDWHSAGNAET